MKIKILTYRAEVRGQRAEDRREKEEEG